MKNIYLDTTQIHDNSADIGIFVSPEIEGLEASEIRFVNSDIPILEGTLVINQLYGARLITLTGMVYADTVADYRTNRRTLLEAAKIKRDGDGNITPITLKFKTMDDLELQTDVYTKQSPNLPDTFLTHSRFKLDLLAPDFRLYSQTEITDSTGITSTGGGTTIPAAIPAPMGGTTTSPLSLVNSGAVYSNPVITIKGPGTNFNVQNLTNGEKFDLNLALTELESVVIDTRARTAFKGNQNVFGSFSGDWMVLEPGTNDIVFTVQTGSDANTLLTLVFRSAWLGV